MSQAKRLSMSESPTKKSSRAATKKKSAPQGVTGSVPVLSFPASIDVPSLTSLTDKRSAYASVARTCLQLNLFAGSASSAASSDDNNNALFHDASYAKSTSAFHAALIECAQTHEDRRCRILACKTLALVARSAYARIRHTPLLFGVREGTLHRLEDEVGTDVPVALCSVALEDVDDGVSACSVEALGMLTLSNAGMVGTSVEDVLLREMEAIAHARPSPNAPTLILLEDDDFSIAQLELQSRVHENVLSPRLWRLVRRILQYGSLSHLMRSLPFLTACLGHLVVHTMSFGMDRSDYAKRWVEIDAAAMVDEVVSSLLLPAMQQYESGLAHCAALCTLRLAHVCPNASWVPQACPWVVSILIDEGAACQTTEQKTATLAALLIALRAIPLPERTATLEYVANEVRFLPSTTRVPRDVVSPGMLLPKDGSYRRPARIGFLSEIAVSFFVDEDNADDGSDDANVRSKALKRFLSSAEVTAILAARAGKKRKKSRVSSNQSVATASSVDGLQSTNAQGGKTPTEEYAGTHVGEEIVLAFCQVASRAGRLVMMPRGGNVRSSRNLEDWLRSSLSVLSTFSACINWRSRTIDTSLTEEDHDVQTLFTVLAAAQGSYIVLLQECLYTVGLLSPASSVSLHVAPLAVPTDIAVLEKMAQATLTLFEYEPVKGVQFAHKDLATLVDQFLEYKIREGISSRHMRILLLALVTDHWVQSSHTAIAGGSRDASEPAAMNINELNARELLATLSEQISSLSREIDEHQEKGQELRNTNANGQYLRVCVACVENVALTACEFTRRFGSFRIDLDEDARYIISVALAALEGKNLRDGDVTEEQKLEQRAMMPSCTEAARRIQDVASAGDSLQTDAFGIGGEAPALYSSLVAAARLDMKSGVEYTPYLSSLPIRLSADASSHAHLTQYCLQVIGSRFDLAMWSSPLAVTDDGEERKTQNRLVSETLDGGKDTAAPYAIRARSPLRLATPPPPPPRLPTIRWSPGGRMCWNGSTSMVTAGSDPVAVMFTYVARHIPRYDCEPEYRIEVTMKIHNITAVVITKGVRLGLSVTLDQSVLASPEVGRDEHVLFSSSTVYKHPLKGGDHLEWEVSLPHLPSSGMIALHPSVTFRDTEGEQVAPKWVEKTDDSAEGTETFTEKVGADITTVDEGDGIVDVTFSCESIPLTFMATLQPCPLVFFRYAYGDESVFRYLWQQLPYRSTPLKLIPNVKPEMTSQTDELADAVGKLSSVWLREWISSMSTKMKGWAFSTFSGYRLFCVMATSGNREGKFQAEEATLQIRADDKGLINYAMSEKTECGIVAALTSNHWRCEDTATKF